jgi:hypothetical protein
MSQVHSLGTYPSLTQGQRNREVVLSHCFVQPHE